MLWFANALIVIGLWTLGYKWRHAFLFSIAGEAIYTVVALRTGAYELGFICAVFCVLAFRNWVKWAPVNEERERALERAKRWQ